MYGDGLDDELFLEPIEDYTWKIGFLKFFDYNNKTDAKNRKKSVENLLNRVWYQPEEIFPVNGTPEVREHAFWVPVDKHYFKIAKKLQVLYLLPFFILFYFSTKLIDSKKKISVFAM